MICVCGLHAVFMPKVLKNWSPKKRTKVGMSNFHSKLQLTFEGQRSSLIGDGTMVRSAIAFSFVSDGITSSLELFVIILGIPCTVGATGSPTPAFDDFLDFRCRRTAPPGVARPEALVGTSRSFGCSLQTVLAPPGRSALLAFGTAGGRPCARPLDTAVTGRERMWRGLQRSLVDSW